jgi:hypothetical protein
MRVKKRVKRGVKKGIKSAKSAPPEAYLGGVGLLVGVGAVLLLATTKTGQELLSRTVERVLRPEEEGEEESQESDGQEDEGQEPAEDAGAQEDVDDELAEDADVEEQEDTGDEESQVTDLKPRDQGPRSPRKAPRPRKAASA